MSSDRDSRETGRETGEGPAASSEGLSAGSEDLGAGDEGLGAGSEDLGASDDLEALSTRELHDRAIHRAERHMDLKFMWSLLKMIPEAEVAAGDEGEGEYDAESMKGLIWDAVHSGDGALGEALRPVFIDYLRRHPDA